MFDTTNAASILAKVIPSLETKQPLLPEGVMIGRIGQPSIQWSGVTKTGENKIIIRVPVYIQSEEAAEIAGVAEPRVDYPLWVDVDDDGNYLNTPGKNRSLGYVLQSFGLNDGTHTVFELNGLFCMATVGTTTGKDGVTRNEVKRIIAIEE